LTKIRFQPDMKDLRRGTAHWRATSSMTMLQLAARVPLRGLVGQPFEHVVRQLHVS
jgi:hypothetical protein